jgi:hypothetical protein
MPPRAMENIARYPKLFLFKIIKNIIGLIKFSHIKLFFRPESICESNILCESNFTIWFGSNMAELAPFFPGNKHAHVYTTEAIKRSRIEESN